MIEEVKKEIQRQLQESEERLSHIKARGMVAPNEEQLIIHLKGLLSFIDTLEVKEVDFEREMQAFAKIYLEPLVISDLNIGISITMSQLYNCAKHFFELGVSCQANNINMEEVKAAAKAWSEDYENTRGCDYIGATVAERAFVACAEWLINKAQKGEEV